MLNTVFVGMTNFSDLDPSKIVSQNCVLFMFGVYLFKCESGEPKILQNVYRQQFEPMLLGLNKVVGSGLCGADVWECGAAVVG